MIRKEYKITKYICERCKTEYDEENKELIQQCQLCKKDMCHEDKCEETVCDDCEKEICYDCSKVVDNDNLNVLCNPCFAKTDYKEWIPTLNE